MLVVDFIFAVTPARGGGGDNFSFRGEKVRLDPQPAQLTQKCLCLCYSWFVKAPMVAQKPSTGGERLFFFYFGIRNMETVIFGHSPSENGKCW